MATPGLTSLRDPDEARRVLLDDALAGVELVRQFAGPVVDVGSGGGTPGIPLAAALPDREVTLLEAERRKAGFLEGWAAELPNVRVIWGRAEEQATDRYEVAVAKALAQPPVAAEWCLPLVAEGGAVVLWVGPSADAGARRARRGADRRRARGLTAGLPRPTEGRTDAARLSAPPGNGEEAPARLVGVDPEGAVRETGCGCGRSDRPDGSKPHEATSASRACSSRSSLNTPMTTRSTNPRRCSTSWRRRGGGT